MSVGGVTGHPMVEQEIPNKVNIITPFWAVTGCFSRMFIKTTIWIQHEAEQHKCCVFFRWGRNDEQNSIITEGGGGGVLGGVFCLFSMSRVAFSF